MYLAVSKRASMTMGCRRMACCKSFTAAIHWIKWLCSIHNSSQRSHPSFCASILTWFIADQIWTDQLPPYIYYTSGYHSLGSRKEILLGCCSMIISSTHLRSSLTDQSSNIYKLSHLRNPTLACASPQRLCDIVHHRMGCSPLIIPLK